jgi:hypothetical protein
MIFEIPFGISNRCFLSFAVLADLFPIQARNAKLHMVHTCANIMAFIGVYENYEIRTLYKRTLLRFASLLTIGFLLPVSPLFAQQAGASKPTPDTLLLMDGEKLIGQFLRSTGSSLVFKSDAAGEVTVDWSKVQDLQSTNQFAVIEKGVRLRNKQDIGSVPQGNLRVENQQLQVTAQPSGTPTSVPFSSAAYVLDQATFRKNLLNNPGFFSGWSGNISAGASLVEATQSSSSYTSAISLVRALPGEKWLTPRNRTVVDFLASYGEVTQTNTPTIKTNIIHGDIERDEYLSPKLYLFGAGAWDHNFSQGLDLQQTYGGGLGWTAYKTDTAELNFRASINYIRQQFTNSAFNQNLVGSTFGENYNQKLPRGVNLTEALSITPAWNNLNAYSALGSVTLGLPLYKRFDLTLGIVDSFLNNPPPNFRKNSFQFITALTYTLP